MGALLSTTAEIRDKAPELDDLVEDIEIMYASIVKGWVTQIDGTANISRNLFLMEEKTKRQKTLYEARVRAMQAKIARQRGEINRLHGRLAEADTPKAIFFDEEKMREIYEAIAASLR